MLKVAILDDYQNVSQEFVDLKKLSGKYEFKIFSEPFVDEAEAIEQLADFEALLIMRERTPITKNLIDNLNVDELKKLALRLFYSFKSYDLVDLFVQKISKIESVNLIAQYRELMKIIIFFLIIFIII